MLMNLADVLSDKPVPARVPIEEPVTDVKPEPTETVEPAAAPSAAKEPEPAKEPAPTQARDDKGKFTKPQEEVDGRTIALREERRKRQEAERQLQELQQAKPKTDFFENPDQALQERLSSQLAPIQERFFKLSVKAAKNVAGREDYEEVAQAFAEAADNDPALMAAFRNADDPGEYAYTVGKQFKELGDVGGDITKYREKIDSQWKGKMSELETRLTALEAENKALKESHEKRAKVPQSLNSEPSAASTAESFAGPRPLKSILFS
jgi:hypothetical protein